MARLQYAEWSLSDDLLALSFGLDVAGIIKIPMIRQLIAEKMYAQIMELGSLDIFKPVVDEILRVLSNFPTIIDQIVIPFIGSNPDLRRAVWNEFQCIFNLDPYFYLLTQGLPQQTQPQRQLEAELLDYASRHPMTPAKLQVWTLLLTGDLTYQSFIEAWFAQVKSTSDQSA